MAKGQWPNLRELQIGKIGLNLGAGVDEDEDVEDGVEIDDGVSPRCLAHLEGANWKLTLLSRNFKYRLSIHYFSTVVRAQTR